MITMFCPLPVRAYIKDTVHRRAMHVMIGDKTIGFFIWQKPLAGGDYRWFQHRDTIPTSKTQIIGFTVGEAVEGLLHQQGYLGDGTAWTNQEDLGGMTDHG